jgi:hypothetical protein
LEENPEIIRVKRIKNVVKKTFEINVRGEEENIFILTSGIKFFFNLELKVFKVNKNQLEIWFKGFTNKILLKRFFIQRKIEREGNFLRKSAFF